MNIKDCQSKAIKILADPFADERTWLRASEAVGQNDIALLPKGLTRFRDDAFRESYCGVTVGVFLSVLVFTPHHYCYAVISYALMMLCGTIYLNSPAKVWRTNFFVGLALAVSVTFALLTILTFLPHDAIWL